MFDDSELMKHNNFTEVTLCARYYEILDRLCSKHCQHVYFVYKNVVKEILLFF
jgi:hypothetical protein